MQINTTANSGSTGRIAEDIGRIMLNRGHKSYIGYGRTARPSASELIPIGGKTDQYLHGLKTALLDRHGFASTAATDRFIREVEKIGPNAVGMHNVHGYYLNIERWFGYLAESQVPALWTFHDCWPFTGHCTYFDDINCTKWQTGCHSCPKTRKYPSSYLMDNSKSNYLDKNRIFNSVNNLEIVVVSHWMRDLLSSSFLAGKKVHVIHNGVDLSVFKPRQSGLKDELGLQGKKVVMGCANIWDRRKGLDDIVKLRELLPPSVAIVVVGLNEKQLKAMPEGVLGFTRTESVEKLVEFYNMADVFVNPTYQDNFPTTNVESLACGTPVVTYRTGGSPEAIDELTGVVVDKGDLKAMARSVGEVLASGSESWQQACRRRAEMEFDHFKQFSRYAEIFERIATSH